MNCPSCQKTFDNSAFKFCPHCGSQIASPPAPGAKQQDFSQPPQDLVVAKQIRMTDVSIQEWKKQARLEKKHDGFWVLLGMVVLSGLFIGHTLIAFFIVPEVYPSEYGEPIFWLTLGAILIFCVSLGVLSSFSDSAGSAVGLTVLNVCLTILMVLLLIVGVVWHQIATAPPSKCCCTMNLK